MSLKNIEEHTAQDYIQRELEVTRLDRVRASWDTAAVLEGKHDLSVDANVLFSIF